jgi:diphosphomevalonate decarboxylase
MGLLNSLQDLKPKSQEIQWTSPANIAFVKYWGKKGHQIPANPSLSMTLRDCVTKTKVSFTPSEKLSVELLLDQKREDKFAVKIQKYLESLETDLPWIKNLSLKIETKNSFPHGAGIASSASGLSAFALCLTDYIHELAGIDDEALFYKRASFLSRLASGSACRSVYGNFTTWGESKLADTTDKYATPFKVHRDLVKMKDAVMVVSGKEKSVSSRAGHDRMKEHPFAEARFVQAKANFNIMTDALKAGDMERVGIILENEALSLHAMMMTSPDSFTLFLPNSLAGMEMVRQFRRETQIPVYFTLDAGPNLHLIYPHNFDSKVRSFVESELTPYAEKFIFDSVGEGPERC